MPRVWSFWAGLFVSSLILPSFVGPRASPIYVMYTVFCWLIYCSLSIKKKKKKTTGEQNCGLVVDIGCVIGV